VGVQVSSLAPAENRLIFAVCKSGGFLFLCDGSVMVGVIYFSHQMKNEGD